MGVKHSRHNQTGEERSPVPDDHSSLFPAQVARSSDSFDCQYKVVVMGDARTGKSCCMERFVGSNVFHTTYSATIGVDFKLLDVVLDETRIRLQLWETGGLETFRSLSETFYRHSQGLIAVYDVTSKESFEHVPYWIEKAMRQGHPEAPIMLMGNKCDSTQRKEVRYETARDFTDEHNYGLFEVSAKDGTNIEMALMSLVTRIRLKHLEHLLM